MSDPERKETIMGQTRMYRQGNGGNGGRGRRWFGRDDNDATSNGGNNGGQAATAASSGEKSLEDLKREAEETRKALEEAEKAAAEAEKKAREAFDQDVKEALEQLSWTLVYCPVMPGDQTNYNLWDCDAALAQRMTKTHKAKGAMALVSPRTGLILRVATEEETAEIRRREIEMIPTV